MRGVTMAAVVAVAVAAAGAVEAQVIVRRGGPDGVAGTMRMSMGSAPGPFLEAPASYGVTGWRVGQWARYSVTQNAGPMPITQIRTVSIVGQRGNQYWVETQDEFTGMMSARGPTRKMLIPFGAMRERVGTEVYTMMLDSSVRRETLVRAGGGDGPNDFTFPQGWQRVGEEQVQVVAGTMRAVRWRRGEESLWTSAEAGPVGLVKYESPALSIELGSRGADARSRIPFGE
jgi:hypothetical protein